MRSRAIRLFDIFGFEIKVDPSWLLIAALIVWSLSSSFFPELVPGLTQIDYVLISTFAMLALFGCLILHELSHSLVARQFGLRVGGITLFLFGGVAELDEEPASPKSEFWIAVAGPAMSFALAGVATFLLRLAEAANYSLALQAVLGYLALINMMLAVFNLLPAFPMDGGRVLRAILWRRSGDMVSATRIASNAGSMVAYAIIAFGMMSLFTGEMFGGIWLILIGVFLLSAARATYQQVFMKSALEGKTVQSLMTRLPKSVDPDALLDVVAESFMLEKAISFAPVTEGDRLLGYVDTEILRGIDRENWSNTHVSDVFVITDATNTIEPGMPTEALLRKISETGRRKFLVAENGRLLGVVTLADLVSYISVLQELGTPTGKPTERKKQALI